MTLLDTSLTRRRTLAIAGASAAAFAVSPASKAFAQDASPAAEGGEEGGGMPPLPEGATLVAEGLWNPGNLAFGPDGTLYIAETGVAGGGPEEGAPATPGTQGPAPLVAPQVSQVAPDGTQSVLTTEAGGIGIAVHEGEVYVAAGGSSVGMGLLPVEGENSIHAINIETGEVRFVAELGAYEAEFNPDGTDINPNLYGLDITSDGVIYVADAGGNTIYTVDTNGANALFAVVPDLTTLTGAEPDPEFGPRQPVPTSVVIDDGGFINVGLLSEGWDGPNILAFAPDATYTEGVSGLTMVVSLALGPDGLMYASSLTADFSGEMPAPGNVFRINADGTLEAVVEGLFFPHGIAFDADGNLFVTVNSIISAPDAPMGQVLRFDGIAV
jgi:outer membrane protein assembly factor BamB